MNNITKSLQTGICKPKPKPDTRLLSLCIYQQKAKNMQNERNQLQHPFKQPLNINGLPNYTIINDSIQGVF